MALLLSAAAVGLSAQSFTTLASFNGSNGSQPGAALVQGADGNFYGTTSEGGNGPYAGFGTVFKITPGGTLTTLYAFCSQPNCTDGAAPQTGFIQAADGNFYGTTTFGGAAPAPAGGGTVFKITPAGTLTTLYTFSSDPGNPGYAGGNYPFTGVIQALDGNLYGTTQTGGDGQGTVFKLTLGGTLTILHSFCSQGLPCTDGTAANGLIEGADGNFYGTTYAGGANGSGTIFRITPQGTLTTVHSFCSQPNCIDGQGPQGRLVQVADGNFYGTTTGGGTSLFGTVFKITPAGAFTTLYSFCSQSNCADGSAPWAGLIQASDGNFYGTTSGGDGGINGGTAFKSLLRVR